MCGFKAVDSTESYNNFDKDSIALFLQSVGDQHAQNITSLGKTTL